MHLAEMKWLVVLAVPYMRADIIVG